MPVTWGATWRTSLSACPSITGRWIMANGAGNPSAVSWASALSAVCFRTGRNWNSWFDFLDLNQTRFPVYVQYVQVACSCFLMLMGISLPARDFWVYFGTYTEGSSKGIYVSRLNADTGELSSPKLAVVTPDPSYLALAPDGKYLYSANEIAGNSGLVSAFAIQPASGQLEFLNQKDSGGSSPCHVSVD